MKKIILWNQEKICCQKKEKHFYKRYKIVKGKRNEYCKRKNKLLKNGKIMLRKGENMFLKKERLIHC